MRSIGKTPEGLFHECPQLHFEDSPGIEYPLMRPAVLGCQVCLWIAFWADVEVLLRGRKAVG